MFQDCGAAGVAVPWKRRCASLRSRRCCCWLALAANAADLRAAELLMFEDASCGWCRRWHADVGQGYPHSEEGRRAPLRRLHIRDQDSAGVSLARPVQATPTFVLVEAGREVGRIVGHPGRRVLLSEGRRAAGPAAARAAGAANGRPGAALDHVRRRRVPLAIISCRRAESDSVAGRRAPFPRWGRMERHGLREPLNIPSIMAD